MTHTAPSICRIWPGEPLNERADVPAEDVVAAARIFDAARSG